MDNPYVTGIESAARNATIARNHIVARQSMPLSALLCEISGTSKELKILDNTIISDSKDHEGIAIYPVQGQSAAIHTLYILGNTIRTPNAKDKAALYVTVYAQDRKGFTIDEANIIGNTINTGSANHAAVGVKVNGFPCHCIVVGTFNFRNNTIKCGSGSEALNIFDLCGTTMYIDGNHFEYNSEGGRGLAIEKTTVDYLHVKNNTVINNNDKPGGPMYLYANKFVWFVDNFVKNYYRDILSTNGCDLFYSGNKTDTVSGPPPEAIKVGTIYTQLGANRKTIYKRYATNDPKPIAAIEYALTGDKAYMVEAHVMVTQGANGAAFVRRALIYRDNAGNAALQGICIDEMTVKSPSDTTQCTIGVSNVNKGNIQLLVTGVAADASLEAELEVYSNGE